MIFRQPDSCLEDEKFPLFTEIPGFKMNEYDVLDHNGVFKKLDKDNPYWYLGVKISDIYDRQLHEN